MFSRIEDDILYTQSLNTCDPFFPWFFQQQHLTMSLPKLSKNACTAQLQLVDVDISKVITSLPQRLKVIRVKSLRFSAVPTSFSRSADLRIQGLPSVWCGWVYCCIVQRASFLHYCKEVGVMKNWMHSLSM